VVSRAIFVQVHRAVTSTENWIAAVKKCVYFLVSDAYSRPFAKLTAPSAPLLCHYDYRLRATVEEAAAKRAAQWARAAAAPAPAPPKVEQPPLQPAPQVPLAATSAADAAESAATAPPSSLIDVESITPQPQSQSESPVAPEPPVTEAVPADQPTVAPAPAAAPLQVEEEEDEDEDEPVDPRPLFSELRHLYDEGQQLPIACAEELGQLKPLVEEVQDWLAKGTLRIPYSGLWPNKAGCAKR